MSPSPLPPSPSPTAGTPAAPPVPEDCKQGTLGYFHTLERLKVSFPVRSPCNTRDSITLTLASSSPSLNTARTHADQQADGVGQPGH